MKLHWLIVGLCLALIERPALAQSTTRVSVSSSGAQANNHSSRTSISADGRFVAFESDATNLVAGDTNGYIDVFVHDCQLGTTERVSVATGGGQGAFGAEYPSISADGRFVAFHSSSPDLVAGDTNGYPDIFVRDRQLGTTERVSVATGGTQVLYAICGQPSISADGRFVTFDDDATNLVAGDTNGYIDVFVHDRQLVTTERVSLDSTGAQGNADSGYPSISADGRFVAFKSDASNLVTGDTNGTRDIFVYDRQYATTERISVDSASAQANSWSDKSSISADGRFVAFGSNATNLVAGDTNGWLDVFVRDRQNGTTDRVSVDSSGAQANADCEHPAESPSWISGDGRYVTFESAATNLIAGDTNGITDSFVHDRQLGTTERVSVNSGGAQVNGISGASTLSGDGRFVAFSSGATNLVTGDTNGKYDTFLRDRGAPPPAVFCSPGLAGVIGCPCSNPSSGTDRGCDNSAGTGGAWINAGGTASLAADTLVFTTGAEKPTATSIVLSGTSTSTAGTVFGQGVRCVAGLLKRLYVKTASGGSITAPSGPDPSVSARSAALGDTIIAGQHRYYTVYYRDPIVLGGCPATSTFNATNAVDASWGP